MVTAIVAIWQYRVTVTGEQNHAGTTSMTRRRDAGLALVRLLAAIDRRFPEICGPRTVWTTGRITLQPGSHSIIPGRADSLFQLRDADRDVLDRLHAELFAAGRGGEPRRPLPDRDQRDLAVDAGPDGRAADGGARRIGRAARARQAHPMPSGAGHDAQWLARKLPAAMMFVPSIGGISHHWSENTSDADIVLGAQVFTDAIVEALRR